MSAFNSEAFGAEAHGRQHAYSSWDADGRPEGRHLEHRERALTAKRAPDAVGAATATKEVYYEGGISAQPPVV